MLNLDGVDLICDPDRQAEEFITRYVPTDLYMPWRRESWPGFGTAGLTYPTRRYDEPKFKLGRFHWPSGAARWAFGHFLATSDMVAAILPDSCSNGTYLPLPFILGNPETGGEYITVSVYMLPPTPLSGIRGLSQSATGSASLYLLTIVDVRYFWWWLNMGNVQVTSSTSWLGLFKICQSQTSAVIQVDNIPSTYLQPSTMFSLPYEPLPIILDAICFNVGLRLVALYNGTFYAMSYATSLQTYQTDLSNNPQRVVLAGGSRFNNPL